jgi:uncharacterized protein YecE (DUF72 family)
MPCPKPLGEGDETAQVHHVSDVYVYFDNDQKSAAPKDAQRLKEIVEQYSQKNARMKCGRHSNRPTSS